MKQYIILFLLLFSAYFCYSQSIDPDDYTFGTQVYVDSTLNIIPEVDRYYISYSLDTNYISPINVDTIGQNFVWYKFEGYEDCDYRDSVGIPALPVKSINLQLPSTSYGEMFSISDLQITYKEYYIDRYYYPYQSCPNSEVDTLVFSFNADYYTQYHNTWNEFITISEPYTAFGATGITVNINPVVYDPTHGIIRIIKTLNCTVPIHGGSLEEIPLNELVNANSLFDCPFCNVEQRWMEIGFGKILVITDASYVTALNEYKDFREDHGYQVEIVTTNYIRDSLNVSTLSGGNIREFIRGRYYNTPSPKRPRYLLLVGDETIIPYSDGVANTKYHPLTDLYYGCIEKQNFQNETNLFPEMTYGRWPVSSPNQIPNIIMNLIDYDKYIKHLDKNTLSSFLVSGIDLDPKSGFFNELALRLVNQVSGILDKKEFSNIHLYRGEDYIGKTDALQDSLKNAMLNNLWMFVYSGHGSPYGLCDPLSLNVSKISGYVYSAIPPITLSFACSTNANNINLGYMFGRSWITERGKGGLIHYGATNTSFTDSNEYLAVNIFNRLSKTNNVVGRWLQSGAGHYYNSFKSPRRRRQVEKYNIFGDPSQYIFGTPSRYVLMSPEYKENLSLEFVDNQIILSEKIIEGKITVFDCVGRLVFSSEITNESVFTPNLPSGVYIANISNKSGTYSYKFIVAPNK